MVNKNYVGNVYMVKNEKAVGVEIKGTRPALCIAESLVNGKSILLVVYLSSTNNSRKEICKEIKNIVTEKSFDRTIANGNQVASVDANRVCRFIEKADESDIIAISQLVKDYIDGKFDIIGNRITPVNETKELESDIIYKEQSELELDSNNSDIDKLILDLLNIRREINNINIARDNIINGTSDILDNGIFKCLSDNQVNNYIANILSSLEFNIESQCQSLEERLMNYLFFRHGDIINDSFEEKYNSLTRWIKEKNTNENIIVRPKLPELIKNDNDFATFDEYIENLGNENFTSPLTKDMMTIQDLQYLILNKNLSRTDIGKIYNTSASTIYRFIKNNGGYGFMNVPRGDNNGE